jgi:membrane fusion protein (multidrug efflux system)
VPQDNATGNFVKVEQRLPVKIRFTKDNSAEDISLLRAGLNVECEMMD